jgi:hypothetical protein
MILADAGRFGRSAVTSAPMSTMPSLEAMRAAAVAVLGAEHATVVAIDRAIATRDTEISRSAFDRFRQLPQKEVRAIIALADCPSWIRRNAEAALQPHHRTTLTATETAVTPER